MKQHSPKIRGRRFYSLFFSFLLIVFLPLIVLSGLFSMILDRAAQDEYLQNSSQLLEALTRQIDGKFSDSVQSSIRLSSNQAMKRLMASIDETSSETIEAMREISSYTSSIGWAEDLCAMTAVYLPERDIIVTNTTYSTRPEDFYNFFLDFEGVSAAEFYDDVAGSRLFFFDGGRKSNSLRLGTRRYLCHSQPIMMGYRNKHAFYISLYDATLLDELLAESLPAGSYYRILAPDASELLSSPEWTAPGVTPAQLKKPGQWELALGGKDYLAFSIYRPATGLQYLFYLPRPRVFQQLTQFQFIIMAISLFLLAVGAVLARLLTRQHYAPLQSLLNQAYPDGIPKKGEEYSLLSQKYEETKQQNAQFIEEIREQSQRIRNDILLHLLADAPSCPESTAKALLAENNLDFPLERFHVVLLRGYPVGQLEGDGLAACVLSPEEGALIVNDAPPEKDRLTPLLNRLGRIRDENPSVQAGCSGAGYGLSSLGRCFREASCELAPRPTGSQSGQLEQPIYYPMEREVQLISALNAGDFAQCRQLLENLRETNQGRRLPPEMMTCLFHNMIATGCRAYESMQLKQQEPLQLGLKALDPRLDGGQLFAQVLKMYEALCSLNLQNQKDKNERVISRVVLYIQQNHCDPNLTLEAISSTFKVSYYYLSRAFREEAGRSFSDVLNQSRVLHATQLLRETALSAQDISAAVGYVSVNTFFRVFRKVAGTTPQQYRKLCQSGKVPGGISEKER